MEDGDRARKAPRASGAGPYADSLRAAIDAGKTGDKIAFPDPAAAPLGADDEAAGHPPAPQAVRMAQRSEIVASATRQPVMGAFIAMVLFIIFAGASFILVGYLASR